MIGCAAGVGIAAALLKFRFRDVGANAKHNSGAAARLLPKHVTGQTPTVLYQPSRTMGSPSPAFFSALGCRCCLTYLTSSVAFLSPLHLTSSSRRGCIRTTAFDPVHSPPILTSTSSVPCLPSPRSRLHTRHSSDQVNTTSKSHIRQQSVLQKSTSVHNRQSVEVRALSSEPPTSTCRGRSFHLFEGDHSRQLSTVHPSTPQL